MKPYKYNKPQWRHFLIAKENVTAFISNKLTACGAEFQAERRYYTDKENLVTCPRCLEELSKGKKNETVEG